MADAALEVRGVVKEYGADEVVTRVLHGVDLALGRGEFTALMGPSGSGKSTLLNLVGLLDRPTAGRIVVDGRDTGALDDRALTRYRGRTLGFIFQFHHLLPEFSAVENVMLPMMADRGRPDPSMRECAAHLLAEVGLGAYLDRRAAVTFLVVTHDPRLAARCDRVVEILDGRLVADRPNRRTP